MEEKTIWVRRQYDDYRKAKYYLKDVSDIHWDKISGGVGAIAPNWSLYGYVNCQGMIEGEVAHSGVHGPCPHRIKICILKIDNDADIIQYIIDNYAGEQPRKFTEEKKHWCITDILDILKNSDDKYVNGDILLRELEKRGQTQSAFVNAVKKHQDKIEKVKRSDDKRKYAYKLKKNK